MFCDYLRVMGLLLLLGCWLSTTRAADVTADSTPRGQAWAVLTRKPSEMEPSVLPRAILDIVRVGSLLGALTGSRPICSPRSSAIGDQGGGARDLRSRS